MRTLTPDQFEQLLNGLAEPLFLCRKPGFTITFVNQAALQYRANHIQPQHRQLGTFFADYFVKNTENGDGKLIPFKQWLRHQAHHSPLQQIELYKENRLSPYYSLNFFPITKNGVATRWAFIFRYIRQEEKLKRNVSLFIHLLGHELKQPLGLMKAYVYYLQKFFHANPQPVSQYTSKIDDQINVLATMINDLVDTSKVSLRSLKIQKEPINITRLLTTIITDLQAAHPQRRIRGRLQPELVVPIDPIRIRQVMMNLILNAVKYSPPDSPIMIHLRHTKKFAVITVSDRGPGIPPDTQQIIFDPYVRVTQHHRQLTKGLGLGLSLVKAIVDQHDGQIKVKSAVNQGSQFIVYLPLST